MADYVTREQLEASAEAGEDTQNADWDRLASAASRLFDRVTEVPDGFYSAAPEESEWKSYRAAGTPYVAVLPYTDTIDEILVKIEGDEIDAEDFIAQGDYLVFNYSIARNALVEVKAKYGFAAIPPDVAQACIEQGLFMWRRKDTAFTEIAGVSAAVVQAEFSPTFKAVTDLYRARYSQNNFFS